MIFKPELVRQIARGKKTQTRRPPRHPTLARRANGTTYTTTPWKPKIGHREPVQPGRGKPAALHIIITAVRQEPLANITLADARLEGFRTRTDFANYWMALYDPAWPPTDELLCPTCHGTTTLEDGGPCTAGCDLGVFTPDMQQTNEQIVLPRFQERYGQQIVWVITFQLETDAPRLLTPTARHRGDEHGYSPRPQDAMPHEPEAVPAAYQDAISRQASERDDQARRARGEGRDIRRTIRNAKRAVDWRDKAA